MTPPIRSAQAPVAKPIQPTQKLDPKATESIYDQLADSQKDWEGEMCRFDRDMPAEYCSPEQPKKQTVASGQGQQTTRPAAPPKPGVPNATARPTGQPEPAKMEGPRQTNIEVDRLNQLNVLRKKIVNDKQMSAETKEQYFKQIQQEVNNLLCGGAPAYDLDYTISVDGTMKIGAQCGVASLGGTY